MRTWMGASPNLKKWATHNDASRVPRGSKVRVVNFDSLEEKAKWLDANASLDALRGGLRKDASRFLDMSAEDRAREIQRFVRDHIAYVSDFRLSTGTEGEELADAQSVLKRGFGDCDDKARLFVALVRSAEMLWPLGVRARIRPVFRAHPLEFVHVQANVKWPGSHALGLPEDPNGWLLAELILKGCEIGMNPDDCPRGPNGERQIT